MKQTNNAIKFLMAQYRAIFQNAYFKGLATAAVVTMAMAAGQAQAAADLANDTNLTGKTGPIVIMGDGSSDGTDNKWDKLTLSGSTAAITDFDRDIVISGGTVAANKFFLQNDASVEGSYSTTKNLTINAEQKTNGLSILSNATADKGMTVKFNQVDVLAGSIALNDATNQANTASLSAKTINVGVGTGADNSLAQIQLNKSGSVGNAFSGDDLFDSLSTINLKSGGTITTVIKADADASTINAGTFNITGGDLKLVDNGSSASGTTLALNLVKGSLSNGSISLGATSALNITFKKALTEVDGAAETNKLDLTGGSISGAGAIVVSGDATTGTLTLKVKSGETAGIDLTNASGDLKIASGAIFETDKANLDALAASTLKTTISGGTLKFTDTENIDLTAEKFAGTAAVGTKIGLSNNATILGKEFTLTDNIGAVTVEANTINLKNPTGTALTTTGVKALSTLNVGADSKVQSVTLSAGDLKAINEANPTDDKKLAAAALAESGSFDTVESVNAGKLTIDGTGPTLDVVNGTWTNNNVHVVLGGNNEATLTVGKNDATYKTAAKLVFDNGSKLEIKKGTVTVGNDSSDTVLGAELDISALDSDSLVFTSGSFTAESGGTIVVNQDFINTLTDTTVVNRQATISSGGIFEVVEGLEIDADKLGTSAGNNTLAFTGIDGKVATLKSDSVTINKATGTNVNIGQHGVIEANTLTLNNDVDSQLQNVQLDAGKFVVKQTLTSEGSDLKATLGNANTVLELGKIVKNNGENELASASGSSTLNLDLTTGAKVNVVGGQWGLQNVTVTNGTVTVGNDIAKYDANDKLISAQVSGGKLDQKAGTVTINEGSSAKFTELFTTNGATTTVNGVLTVIGQQNAVTTENTKADFGASIDSNIAVTGANAKLVIGKTALGSIADYQDAGAGIKYTTDVDPLFGNGGKVTLTKFGTLELQFAEGTEFTLNDLASLRKGVTGETDSLEAGFISIGNASLTDSVVSGGAITAENLEKIKDFKDIVIKDIANATVTGVDSNTVVTGNVGNIQAKTNVSEVQIGQATLNKANDKNQFAVDASGKQVNLAVNQGGYLHLVNDGEAKNITLANGVSATQKTNLVVKGKADGKTTIKSVSGNNDDTNFEVASGNVKVTKDVKVGTLNTAKDTTLTAESLNITASAGGTNYTSEIWGTVNVDKNATFAGDLSVGGKLAVSGDLAANGKETYVAKDGQLTVDGMLTLGASSTLHVGLEDEKDAQGNVIESGSTGYLFAKTLNLNGATLFVDPEFGDKTSIAAVKNFGDKKNNQTDAGVIEGNVVVGKNAALMAGQNATIAAMQGYISQYQQNGSLVKGQVENIVYLADKVTLENNSKIILDSKHSSEEIVDEITKGDTGAYAAQFNGAGSKVVADLYLGSNSVLTVSDNILGENQGVAIHFNKDDAAILGASGSKIVLDGESFLNSREFTLFKDNDAGAEAGVKVLGTNNITVESLNGLLVDSLKAGTQAGAVKLSLNKKELDSKLLGASAPMRDFLIGFADRKVNWEEVLNAPAGTSVTPEYLVAGKADILKDDGTIDTTKLPEGTTDKDFVIVTEKVDGQDKKVAYRYANNQFLEKVVRNTDGAAADQAARMGDFGGAAETALVATSTTYDAVAGRFGMGQQAGTMTIANNGQGSGLWVTPVYKSHESDGFDADGLGYGSDITLYGVALGGDVTLANGVRVGAMFNVGSGDADGQGAASVVSNDFDYFGGSIYAGYAIDNFSIVGDISYTTIDSDVEANTAAGKTSTSFDTSALSVGVTGQYALKVAEMDVTPHAGLRFTRIDMDDYTIDSADFGEVGQYNASSANVFSIPVGVTISKEYVTDTWTVKPSFDLTLTGNFGDDTVDGTVSWTGVSNWDVSTKAEFVDNFTYGASVGIAAKTGNFGLGLGLNYTGSSNTDEFGVNANARYMF